MKLQSHKAAHVRTASLVALGWLLLGLANMLAAAAEPGTWRIVSSTNIQSRMPDLPPLAVVESSDDSDKTWRMTGQMPGGLSTVAQDFRACWERQGWRLDKVIGLGRNPQASKLLLWKKGPLGIILMLHDEDLARTGFAVGFDSLPRKSSELARKMPSDPCEHKQNRQEQQLNK